MNEYLKKLSVICVFSAAMFFSLHPSGASETLLLEETFSKPDHGWEKVERFKIDLKDFPVEDYPLDGRGDQEGRRLTYFGDKHPHSSKFLLYYAPGWDKNPKPIPILLVHGANDNADRAWANPNELGYGCGTAPCPNKGLMQYLSEQGYRVFAIGFPHKHGDNLLWAQQIHHAINRIKEIAKSPKVDVVAWSKGAFAARMYVSNVKPAWGASYDGGIRKLVLLGSPNLGTDYAFRHGSLFNPVIFPRCGGMLKVNGPSPHTSAVCQSEWKSYPEYSIYTTKAGDFFPGQKQMLAKLDQKIPLSDSDPDWKTTYYGGKGSQSEGLGIQAAIDQGSLVEQLLKNGVPSSVTAYLLAGGASTIPFYHNEHGAPNDGIVFVASATAKEGIANLGGVTALEKINHLQLAWEASAVEQISAWLNAHR